MSEDTFRFKKFSIVQRRSAMKVGTDGVLIGAWADAGPWCRNILDIGAGTGLIAVMMAQRAENASVTAVEIDPDAALEASSNAQSSPWGGRIEIVCSPIQEYSPEKRFDLIVSNPPYFNGSYKSEETRRMAARHAELLSGDDLLDSAARLLDRENGKFAAIFPYETGTVNIAKAAERGLYCNRICNVKPKEHSAVKRIMVEMSFRRTTPVTEELAITDDGNVFTGQYRNATKDFYLKF